MGQSNESNGVVRVMGVAGSELGWGFEGVLGVYVKIFNKAS